MKLDDIAKVKVDYLTGPSASYSNDPSVTLILKRDRTMHRWEDFRFRQYGNLFFAELEGEVRYVAHDRNDHNGFGCAVYELHMADDYVEPPFNSRDRIYCHLERERDFGSMTYRPVRCGFDSETRIMRLQGPGPVAAAKATGIQVMDIGVLEGQHRESVRNPAWYQKQRRRGRNYEGTAYGVSATVEFMRQAIDVHAPHLELWEGDYGWTVKFRDCPPKNPRRREKPVGHPLMDGAQSAAIYH